MYWYFGNFSLYAALIFFAVDPPQLESDTQFQADIMTVLQPFLDAYLPLAFVTVATYLLLTFLSR